MAILYDLFPVIKLNGTLKTTGVQKSFISVQTILQWMNFLSNTKSLNKV